MSSVLRFIVDQPGWYGRRSGYYTQLPRALAGLGHDVRTTLPCRGLGWRLIGKAWSTAFGLPGRRQTLTVDEVRFHAGWLLHPRDIGVILSIEEHLPGLSYWGKSPGRLIGTIHFPRGSWAGPRADALKRLRSAIVLAKADLDFFASLVGHGRVRFAYHGVDTDFFRPAEGGTAPPERPLFLCVGQFGRDFAQLERAAPVILDRIPHAELRILLAAHADDSALLPALRHHPRVRIVRGISDDELLGLYQRATLMLLPMEAVAASNAVVEALACGLPIVSTDVGGMRDYGGGTLFPIVRGNDDDGFIEEAVRLATNESERRSVSLAMRQFAMTHLGWPQVAADHWRAYQELSA
jgi:glycosyltransferase involved in cell wall biosynthesis